MLTTIANKYRIEASIGADSVARYYRCTTLEEPAQSVIVKLLYPELSERDIVERVRRSVLRFLPALHDNVVRVLEFAQSASDIYYSVDDFAGTNVCDWCDSPRPIEQILPVLHQAAKGLAAVHHAGIIHRNIKAETILVAPDGRVKIAESVIATHGSSADSSGTIVGEIDNVPPEYLEHGELTQQGDLYSLGMVAFEMITGRPPFLGNSVIETMTLRLKGDVPSLREFSPSITEEVAAVISKALKKEPSARFQNALELAESLEKLMP